MTPATLQRFLAQQGWKQKDFAERTGLAENTVSAMLNGRTRIKPWVGYFCAAVAYDLKPLP